MIEIIKPRHYTADDRRVMKYFRLLLDRQYMKDYECILRVIDQPNADEGFFDIAKVMHVPDDKIVLFGYHQNLLERSPDYIRLVLTHEVCHLPLCKLDFFAQVHMDDPEPYMKTVSVEIEFIVNHYAKLIAPSMPLPPFGVPND